MFVWFISGGMFPMPPVAAYVSSMLPPPAFFHGPFVSVDKLMEVFRRLHLPDKAPPATGEGVDPSVFDIAKSATFNTDALEDGYRDHGPQKRRRMGLKREGT